jgi:ABC-type transport system involved in multi-copper enzyme maturation permease subunit
VSRAIPFRYLGWSLRDAALRPGLAALIMAGLATFLATRMPMALTGATSGELNIRLVGQFDWLVILIATSGLVAWDRSSGFYRTLFSYPVNPALYYLQRWILAGLAAALLIPLTGLGFLAVTGTFPFSGPLLVRFLIKYLLLGGITFGFSTIVRADWAIAFVLSAVQAILHGLQSTGIALSPLTRGAVTVLPPFHVGSFGFNQVASYPTGGELAHALLYGAGILVVTMLVLLYRPLGSGGRA